MLHHRVYMSKESTLMSNCVGYQRACKLHTSSLKIFCETRFLVAIYNPSILIIHNILSTNFTLSCPGQKNSKVCVLKTITEPKITTTYHMHTCGSNRCMQVIKYGGGFGYNHHHCVSHAYICCFNMHVCNAY